MSLEIVFAQMIVIVILVCVGIGLYKRKYIDETKKWYMDLAPGIADLVKRLEDSCKQS